MVGKAILTDLYFLTATLLFFNVLEADKNLVYASAENEDIHSLRTGLVKAPLALSPSTNERTRSYVTSLERHTVGNGRAKRSAMESHMRGPTKRIREFVGKRGFAGSFGSLRPAGEQWFNPRVYPISDTSASHLFRSPRLNDVDSVASYLPPYSYDMAEPAMSKRIREFVGKRAVHLSLPAKRIREFVGKRSSKDKRIREFVGKRGLQGDLLKDTTGYGDDGGFYLLAARPSAYRRPFSVDSDDLGIVGLSDQFAGSGGMNKRIREFVGKRGFGIPLTDYSKESVGCGQLCGDYEDGARTGDLQLNQNPSQYFGYGDSPAGVVLVDDDGDTNLQSDQDFDVPGQWYYGSDVIKAAPATDQSDTTESIRGIAIPVVVEDPRIIQKRIREFVGKRYAPAIDLHRSMLYISPKAEESEPEGVNKRIREFVGKRSRTHHDAREYVGREFLGQKHTPYTHSNEREQAFLLAKADKSTTALRHLRGLTQRHAAVHRAGRMCKFDENCGAARLILQKRIREFVGK